MRALARRLAAALTAGLLAVGGCAAPQPAASLHRLDPAPAGITLTGLDAHDGTILRDGDTFYLYGTRYGCGFEWGHPGTPWCGFGVWTGPALTGPWTFQRLLFPVTDGAYTWGWKPWTWVCGDVGGGCFNPRMIRRPDGVWILFFNAPNDWQHGATSVYYALGCAGPAGPCGDTVAGNGSTRRVPLNQCAAPKNGDFTIWTDGWYAFIVCSNETISVELLDHWWTTGTGQGLRDIAGLTRIETPGMLRGAGGEWVMTVGEPNCGYCSGVSTSYLLSTQGPLGDWHAPPNPGWASPALGRSRISGSSCGGQPRTVFTVDGQPWQWIDTWYGQANETTAAVRLEPLVQAGPLERAADGQPWAGGFRPFGCGGD